ncbi:hypothetical protein GURKE_02520 [Brevundimonas phage vB_BpoS-Gurke]|uniref:Uncharacterized protein n=1 Tax=Brevundimonas phage vB_BpoS-Gurke TaxID=2948599 RepID=A0A9E7N203_9CAUD|nr:hypothetical protein GURKE_02520 [Brevundimonas phage vB_BpoS-Gurke]
MNADFDPVVVKALTTAHEDALKAMSLETALVLAREILAARVRYIAHEKGSFVTRRESMEAVLQAEATQRGLGAQPALDFMFDLDLEMPLGVA